LTLLLEPDHNNKAFSGDLILTMLAADPYSCRANPITPPCFNQRAWKSVKLSQVQRIINTPLNAAVSKITIT
jgi:hypothetical protein